MILVDTGPLVALCDERDSLHTRALREIDRLGRRKLVVLSAVLAESYFLLETAGHRARLRALLVRLLMLGLPEEPTEPFRDSVFDWLARYEDHEPDFADACLAVASTIETAAKVWTFDSEFKTIWRRPDGTKIPVVFGDGHRAANRRQG